MPGLNILSSFIFFHLFMKKISYSSHFRFSASFVTFLKDSIGVTSVLDLSYVYSDPALLKEIESSTKRLEFLKFNSTKDFVTSFNPGSNEYPFS